MDLTNQQIKDTYGNVLTIGATAGSPQTGTLQNGEGLNITSATLTGGTVTTSNPLLDMTQTWNDAGVTFTSLKLNVTDTASDSASLLLDLQVGGSSKFSVIKAGVPVIPQSSAYAFAVSGAYSVGFYSLANYTASIAMASASGGNPTAYKGFEFYLAQSPTLSMGLTTLDVKLTRDAAGTLAQRNSTNAQTFNIYNTYTDGSNYEGAALKWDSNVFKIGTFALGTGTLRNIEFVGSIFGFGNNVGNPVININGSATGYPQIKWIQSGSTRGRLQYNHGLSVMYGDSSNEWRFDNKLSADNFEAFEGYTVATLPTPTVGMIARVTDGDAALTFGNTVVNSGAGATPYLCWYNGSNWTVIGA